MEPRLGRDEIDRWLRETNPDLLQELWTKADAVRREFTGDEVHLRGLIEISNYCVRRCAYCGLHAENASLTRYRMTADEIMTCVQRAVDYGYGTVVFQSGEDYGIRTDWMADIVRRIKSETPLAVTLSLGERSTDDFSAWRNAGADRYLIRFETSDPELYARIHPLVGKRPSDRIAILRTLRALGYEIGSGIMVGIPGQSYACVINDLLLFRELDLDMVGVGPYLPHPATPLGAGNNAMPLPEDQQVPNSELMTYKVLALTRLLCPQANIPSTTALATINQINGRELGLQRGANVVMPNLTPAQYRVLYEIYPSKACINETAAVCKGCLEERIRAIGRRVGTGHGGRKRTSLPAHG